jgi:DNA end-binding protein Ku
MPRPIWKGAISFGLVTIPVNLYSAIERRETLSFNLLHKKDNARIQNKRFCSEEGVKRAYHHRPQRSGPAWMGALDS